MSAKAYVTSVIGAAGLGALLTFLPIKEGVRLDAYLDPLGIPTICMGHTANVRMGDRASMDQCNDYLMADLQYAASVFEKHVPTHVRAQMPSETKAAFVSFIYNVGTGRKGVKDGFVTLKNGNKTTMLRYLEAGRIEAACHELPKWNKNRLAGITFRRAEELAMCVKEL